MASEEFIHVQPLANSDPAFIATGPGALTAATPGMTPLMLDKASSKLKEWDGANAGEAIGVLVIAADQNSSHLTYYKTGSFRYEDILWPKAAASEEIKRNAFVGTAISID